jgi:osmotically-inducible protein OsmY
MQPAHLVSRIREALAREEGELGIGVEVLRRVVFLTGVVASEERRERAEVHARKLCGEYAVVNEIAVRGPRACALPEALG